MMNTNKDGAQQVTVRLAVQYGIEGQYFGEFICLKQWETVNYYQKDLKKILKYVL